MRFAALVCFAFAPAFALAFVPVITEQTSTDDVTVIEDHTLSETFYGRLFGFPHTYVVTLAESSVLSLAIGAPKNDGGAYTVSGIIVREKPDGRVEEIARLPAKEAAWDEAYDSDTGDRYRKGPSFKKELPPGTYRIEVHTPDNLEPYMLTVGTRDEGTLSYIELVRRLAAVKVFFGKSQFLILESSHVYIPLCILVLLVVSGYAVYRRQLTAARKSA